MYRAFLYVKMAVEERSFFFWLWRCGGLWGNARAWLRDEAGFLLYYAPRLLVLFVKGSALLHYQSTW